MKNISHYIKNHHRLFEFLIVFLVAFMLEVAFLIRFNIKMPLTYFLLTFGSISFVPALILFIKSSKTRFILYCICLFYIFGIFVTDTTLFYYKGDLFAISMIFDIGDGLKMGINYNIFIAYAWWQWILIVLMIASAVFVLVRLTLGENASYSRLSIKYNIIAFLSVLIIAFGGVFVNGADEKIYSKPQDKRTYLYTFGFSTFQQRDFVTTLVNVVSKASQKENAKKLLDGLDKETKQKKTSVTGSLKNKNVIMIMMETVEDYVIDPELTPNLYFLLNSGYSFKNTYGVAKTNNTYDAEFKSLTSMMYFNADNYMHTYAGNDFQNSLPSVLKKNGYTANSFHSNMGAYFNRTKMHKALGFDHFYAGEEMEFSDYEFYPLDSEMFMQMKDYISPIQDQPFYSFIITYSTHGPYHGERKELEPYFEKIYASHKYDDHEIEFLTLLAAAMDLDKGLGILLDDLKVKDLYEDTVIVLYSDHKNYSSIDITRKYTNLIYPDAVHDYEMDKVPFAIFNPTIKTRSIDYVTSHYDITPTILDLLGIEIVKDYYYGQSVFLYDQGDYENKPIIIGYNRFIDSKIMVYDKDILYYDNSLDDVDAYYQEVQAKVFNEIEKFHALFLLDYFSETSID